MKGYIHSIETFGSVDGPGIRYVVFMQGCPLKCLYCHNPDSWKLKDGKLKSVKEIVTDVLKYSSFISSGGVTISGGEPLLQAKFVLKLINELHKHNIHVALDTAGSLPLKQTKDVLKACDLVMLDIKELDDSSHKTLTGLSNANTLETLDFLESINKPVWIRHVVLPAYTLNENKLTRLAEFLTKFKTIERVELLPFHKFGEYKWEVLGYDYMLKDIQPPTSEEMQKVKKIFSDYSLPVV